MSSTTRAPTHTTHSSPKTLWQPPKRTTKYNTLKKHAAKDVSSNIPPPSSSTPPPPPTPPTSPRSTRYSLPSTLQSGPNAISCSVLESQLPLKALPCDKSSMSRVDSDVDAFYNSLLFQQLASEIATAASSLPPKFIPTPVISCIPPPAPYPYSCAFAKLFKDKCFSRYVEITTYGNNPFRITNFYDMHNCDLFLLHVSSPFRYHDSSQKSWKAWIASFGTLVAWSYQSMSDIAQFKMKTHREAVAIFKVIGDQACDITANNQMIPFVCWARPNPIGSLQALITQALPKYSLLNANTCVLVPQSPYPTYTQKERRSIWTI